MLIQSKKHYSGWNFKTTKNSPYFEFQKALARVISVDPDSQATAPLERKCSILYENKKNDFQNFQKSCAKG